MASKFENEQSHPFDTTARQIEDVFEKLFQILLDRKTSLLEELKVYRIEFDKFIANKSQTEKELETLKQDPDSTQEIQTFEIEEKLHKLNLSASSFDVDFQINIHKIEQEIAKLGRIVKASELQVPKYSQMKSPVLCFGKEGTRREEFTGPRGIAYEEGSGLMFVSDNASIKIFTSTGEFVSDFGSIELVSPWGILLHESFIYVTDRNKCSVLKYQRFNFKFLLKVGKEGVGEGEFHFPMQLAIGPDGDLYVPENKNNRISVLNSDLSFRKFIKHDSLIKPVDVKLKKELVFVLCYSSMEKIHQFNMQGEYIKCVVKLSGVATLFFCLDVANNLLISNWTTNTILIYNNTGVLIHTLGKSGHGKGEFTRPYGLIATKNAKLIVLSNNENYGLQIF